MGMAIDAEGRTATTTGPAAATAAPATSSNAVETATAATTEAPTTASPPTPSAVGDVAGTHGECETSEQKARRLRSNSEETALILTSMMSMSKFAPPAANARAAHGSDDDDDDGSRHSDMGEDMSGDEHDQDMDDEYQGSGHGKGKARVQFGGAGGSKLDFLDEAGFSHRFRNESNRVKSLVTKHISIDELREHFDRPIIDVAKDFGICITLMKKICRRNGIKRWPHRQIRSLSKSIASMEAAMLSSQGPEREKYRDQILSLKLKRDSVIADPNKENSMARPKTPTKEGSSRPHTHIHAAPKLSPRSGSPLSAPVMGAPPPIKTDGQSHSKGGRWTSEEHAAFLHGIRLYGKDWRRVAQVVRTRSAVQTRTHAQKYLLKFAGRFPFDAEGLELKTEPNATPVVSSADVNQPHERVQDGVLTSASPTATNDANDKETDGGDTASMSSSSHDDDASSVAPGVISASAEPSLSSPLESRASAPVALSVDTTSHAKSSALETMAMILNSPQFGSPQFSSSYRQMAPPAIQTQSLSGDDNDVTMESPRGNGVPATLPLLPSFVIKPGTWPSQPPVKSESAVSSPVP